MVMSTGAQPGAAPDAYSLHSRGQVIILIKVVIIITEAFQGFYKDNMRLWMSQDFLCKLKVW